MKQLVITKKDKDDEDKMLRLRSLISITSASNRLMLFNQAIEATKRGEFITLSKDESFSYLVEPSALILAIGEVVGEEIDDRIARMLGRKRE